MPIPNFIKIFFVLQDVSRDSVVRIATRLQRVQTRIRIPAGEKRFVYSPKRGHRLWDPPNLQFHEYWTLFPSGVKRRRRCKADNSPPSSAEIKK